MPKIILKNVTKRWNSFYAVDNLNLTIEDRDFITLLGPSGCGKTTTLRMIAGLETPTSGLIQIGDTVVFDSEKGINVSASKRKVGFLFQNYALWPNMTVYQNIAFGLNNIKEELPIINYDIKINYQIQELLKQWTSVLEALEDCKDKKGEYKEDRALIKLIDVFNISKYVAKPLFNFAVKNIKNFDDIIQEFSNKINKQKEEIKKKGYSINDNFELLKNGEIQKKVRKMHKEEIDLAVRRVSKVVKIGMFMNRYPAELSGGQQQRVAIARTLAPEPVVLFMDEPLSNLDAKLRLEMRSELQRLHLNTKSTFVYVTHDQMEAMTLATKICLINNGTLQQYDPPLVVYNNPKNLFIADFVGNPAINFADVVCTKKEKDTLYLKAWHERNLIFKFNTTIDLNKWEIEENQNIKKEKEKAILNIKYNKFVEKINKDTVFSYPIVKVSEDKYNDKYEDSLQGDYVLGIRPEAITLRENIKDPTKSFHAEVYSAMPTGMESTIRLRTANFLLTAVVFGSVTYELGQKVYIEFGSKNIMLFSRKSGNLIGLGSLTINKK